MIQLTYSPLVSTNDNAEINRLTQTVFDLIVILSKAVNMLSDYRDGIKQSINVIVGRCTQRIIVMDDDFDMVDTYKFLKIDDHVNKIKQSIDFELETMESIKLQIIEYQIFVENFGMIDEDS